MRVAILTKRLENPGGSEISMLTLEEWLTAETTVVGFDNFKNPDPDWIVKPSHRFETQFLPRRYEQLIEYCRENRQFIDDVRRVEPDLIFSHHSLSFLGAYLAHRLSTPHIVFLHDRYMAPSGDTLFERPKLGAGWAGRWIEDVVLQHTYKTATIVIAVSKYLKQLYRDKGVTTPIEVVAPFIDPTEYRVDQPGEKILHVTPTHLKGIDVTLSVAEQLPGEDFLIVGELDPDDETRERIEGLDNVTSEGYYDDMRSVYERTKLVLAPSRSEAFGRVAVEAGFSGIPTVAANTGGLSESVGNSDCLVTGHDPSDYVEIIKTVIKNYKFYSREARTHAENYTAAEQINRLKEVLQEYSSEDLTIKGLFQSSE